jgi:hypothetical protein
VLQSSCFSHKMCATLCCKNVLFFCHSGQQPESLF